MVLRHPVNAGDDIGVLACQAAAENADGVNPDVLRHAVDIPTDDPRHVGAVSVAVIAGLPVVDEVRVSRRSARRRGGVRYKELLISRADARVEDVNVDARAGGRVFVGVVERQVSLINAIQPPRRVGLDAVQRHHAVLFDVFDARVKAERLRLGLGHLRREAFDGVLVDALHRPLVRAQQLFDYRVNPLLYGLAALFGYGLALFGGGVLGRGRKTARLYAFVVEDHDVMAFDRLLDFTEFGLLIRLLTGAPSRIRRDGRRQDADQNK